MFGMTPMAVIFGEVLFNGLENAKIVLGGASFSGAWQFLGIEYSSCTARSGHRYSECGHI